MPIMACAAGCPRLISVSVVPGGNPEAKRDPEGVAAEWTRCDACGRYTCDRCLGRHQGRCGCGQPSRLLRDEERVRIALALAQSRPIPPSGTGVAAQPEPPADPLARYLATVGAQIDGALHVGDLARAETFARHAVGSFKAPPGALTTQDIYTLMRWGEQYYRWRLWDAGVEFWRAAATLAAAQRLPTGDFERAASIAGAMLVLGGRLPASPADTANLLSMMVRVFGTEHVLVRDVVARLAQPPGAASVGRVNTSTAPAPPSPAGASAPTGLLRVGFFRELKHGSPEGPSLRAQVRPAPAPHAEHLVAYLRGCPVLIAAMARAVDVLDPTVGRIGTPSIYTDGVWAWPGDLAHYVARYHIELPSAFIEHARARQWTPVAESSLDLKSLKLS